MSSLLVNIITTLYSIPVIFISIFHKKFIFFGFTGVVLRNSLSLSTGDLFPLYLDGPTPGLLIINFLPDSALLFPSPSLLSSLVFFIVISLTVEPTNQSQNPQTVPPNRVMEEFKELINSSYIIYWMYIYMCVRVYHNYITIRNTIRYIFTIYMFCSEYLLFVKYKVEY